MEQVKAYWRRFIQKAQSCRIKADGFFCHALLFGSSACFTAKTCAILAWVWYQMAKGEAECIQNEKIS